ncbi:hypothetical protein [Streptomyces filamentosus]|uniref:hypothetical protein n=1 Tax=Streptomyces filamentosus TaxID=67294 RepID=UPI001F178C2F|nr:hypothetical protein [Streptomyces filamentosus]
MAERARAREVDDDEGRQKTKNHSKFLEFCWYLRSLHAVNVRIAIACDSYSPHLTTKRCQRVGTRAKEARAAATALPTGLHTDDRERGV